MLADELCRRIEGANYFQWLLTKFSTPEEIFGAVSLKGLEEDDYRRVTMHKLPEAHIAFLDEIFKANSSILNALLTVINERVFHNGRERVQVPLITMFGASQRIARRGRTDRALRPLHAALHGRLHQRGIPLPQDAGRRDPEARTTMTFAELDAARADSGERLGAGRDHRAIAQICGASSRANKSSSRIGAGKTRSMCCARMRSCSGAISSPRTI